MMESPLAKLQQQQQQQQQQQTCDSRLGNFTIILGSIFVFVLVMTTSSIVSLGNAFGGSNNAASRIRLRVPSVQTETIHNNNQQIDNTSKGQSDVEKAVLAIELDHFAVGDFPDSEDEGFPLSPAITFPSVEKEKVYDNETNDRLVNIGLTGDEVGPGDTTSSSDVRGTDDEGQPGDTASSSDAPESKDEEQPAPSTSNDAIDSFPKLLDSVLEARRSMIDKLKKDYGEEYFERIFRSQKSEDEKLMPESLRLEYLPFRPLGPNDVELSDHWHELSSEMEEYNRKINPNHFASIQNFERKMMIKILTAHNYKIDDGDDPEPASKKYVWATGGHSAAAGHGNFFHESYTKVMEASSAGVFEASGLEFEARNYAMGATASAAEMSMCFKEIYGDDVDVFSWDFGMLEARDYLTGRLLHYSVRGFLSNQKTVPVFVGLQEIDRPRRNMMMELHDAYRGGSNNVDDDDDGYDTNGLALFLRDEGFWKDMKEVIPDTFGLTTDEINDLPELVRYYKCDGQIEKGDPYCGENKYTKGDCPERMGHANWHPGWKYNALLGNSMSLFLTEILVNAVRKLEVSIHTFGENPGMLLSRLLTVEDSLRNKMVHAPVSQMPRSFQKVYWYNNTSDDWKNYQEEEANATEIPEIASKWSALDREALFHGPSICHTARLPAQTRFFGHLTNQPEMTGKQAVYGKETYFTGINEKAYHSANQALAIAANNTEISNKSSSTNNDDTNPKAEPHDMQLVWVVDKERQEGCGDVLAKPDYHDYFMTEDTEGWTSLSFPNAAEQKAYGFHEHKEDYKGFLIIVPRFCAFGRCEEGFLGQPEYNDDKWTIRVNGKTVTALTMIGHEAVLLEHADGIVFDPNEKGTYDLEIRVNEPDSFIKISAFILY